MHDALDMPILDCALPLRASLLYENGLPVKQARLSPLHRDATRGEGLQSCSSHCLRAAQTVRAPCDGACPLRAADLLVGTAPRR